MSASALKADMLIAGINVRYVPIADIQHEASIGRAEPVADACLGQNVLRACLAGCKDHWQGEGQWMNSLRRGLTLFTDN